MFLVVLTTPTPPRATVRAQARRRTVELTELVMLRRETLVVSLLMLHLILV